MKNREKICNIANHNDLMNWEEFEIEWFKENGDDSEPMPSEWDLDFEDCNIHLGEMK